MAGNASVLCDAQGNMVAGYAGTNVPATQPAIVTAGNDYSSPAKAQVPKVDPLGQQYVVPTSPNGLPVPVLTNSATPTFANAYGQIALAWCASTGTWLPFQVDATGASVVRQATTATFDLNISVATGTQTNKSMISIFNAGTTYQRIAAIYAVCAPQINTSGGLLGVGSGTTYTQILMALYRITGHTSGTVVNFAAHDPSDTLDVGLSARTGATVQGEISPTVLAWDAAYDATFNAAARQDQNVKLITLPPGTGLHVRMVGSLSNSVTFTMRVVLAQNVA